MTSETQVAELIEHIIAARDGLRSVENYAGGEFCPVRKARSVMADAANTLAALSTPTHTDLMVSPESLGLWLEKDDGARVICDFMNWPEDGPAWDDAHKLYAKLHAPAPPVVCGFCRAEFLNTTAMADHIAASHGPGDRTGQRYRTSARATAIQVGQPMPYYCPACEAIPSAGYCKLAGCPTAPDGERS